MMYRYGGLEHPTARIIKEAIAECSDEWIDDPSWSLRQLHYSMDEIDIPAQMLEDADTGRTDRDPELWAEYETFMTLPRRGGLTGRELLYICGFHYMVENRIRYWYRTREAAPSPPQDLPERRPRGE